MNGVTIKKICKACGKEFHTEWPRQAYCSEDCKMGKSSCIYCGKTFIKKYGTTGKYCSSMCWYAHYAIIGKNVKTCPVCGKEFHGESKTCGKVCGREWQRRNHPNRNFICERCGKPIPTTAKPGRRFCSRSCALTKRNLIDSVTRAEGTRRHHSAGYVLIKIAGNWVLEHRYVMAQQLDRPLEKHERVHHKDGNRANNTPENLELWKVKKKDPAGVRASDYHCAGCLCEFDLTPNEMDVVREFIRKLKL